MDHPTLLACRFASRPEFPCVGLGTFIHDAFDHSESAKAKRWPNLEDLLTNIDLAANTGHHKAQRAFLKQPQGKGSVVHLRPLETCMSERTHLDLLG
jgi:hypothetical protein